MVQLNTSYDSSIHQKIFILKGEESYARTTDTIATLITNFGNYTSNIRKCHVGLEIQVLREIGDSNLFIYCNDELLYSIPWSDSGMAQIIDSDWNDKGVYWENGKLIIGKYDYANHINTGLFLTYNRDHKIEVRYDGNDKCLASKSKPILFNVPKPNTFMTRLEFGVEDPVYHPPQEVDDITLTLIAYKELSSTKMIDIYDDSTTPSTLLDTVELEENEPVTLSLGALSHGLHNIRASWEGDNECYGCEQTVDISYGFNIINIERPLTLIQGQTGKVSFNVLDFFGNPFPDYHLTFKLVEKVNDEWEVISSVFPNFNNGRVAITGASISSRPYAIARGNAWRGESMKTNIIEVGSLDVISEKPIVNRVFNNSGSYAGGNGIFNVTVNNPQGQALTVPEIPLTIHATTPFEETTLTGITDSNGKYRKGIQSKYAGVVNVDVSVTGTEVSNTASWIVAEYWWSMSNPMIQIGTPELQMTMTLSKTSEGFKFSSPYGIISYARFYYNPNTLNPNDEKYPIEGVYLIEFDVTNDEILKDNPYSAVNGHEIALKRNKHYKILHDCDDGSIEVYVDGIYKGTNDWDYDYFEINFASAEITIDNLVIARSE